MRSERIITEYPNETTCKVQAWMLCELNEYEETKKRRNGRGDCWMITVEDIGSFVLSAKKYAYRLF